MSKATAVLDLFPAVYGIREPGKLLASVVESLARPLDEADAHLFRIQRAHRLAMAERTTDILHLAAIVDLTRDDFADVLDDTTLDYADRLELMRRRVRRVAGLHLEGTGTPWAVLEGASIFLDARIQPDSRTKRRLHTLDGAGYTHAVNVESDRGGVERSARMYLYENPRRRRRIRAEDRWPRQEWKVDNESVERAPVRLAIRGVEDRTVRPTLICPDTGQGIRFNGVVPDDGTLIIDGSGARIDDAAVDEWVTFFEGGIYGYSDFTELRAVTETPSTARRPFDRARRPVDSLPIHTPRPVPYAPVGRSRWFVAVDEGVYGGSTHDYAVFGVPEEPVGFFDDDPGFDEAVFWYPPSAIAGMAWDERIPCAFKLSLPRGFGSVPDNELSEEEAWTLGETRLAAALAGSEEARSDRAVAGRISTLLPRFRAAGIQSFVETARPGWTLGKGILRHTDARWGAGVERDRTELANPYADTLIST